MASARLCVRLLSGATVELRDEVTATMNGALGRVHVARVQLAAMAIDGDRQPSLGPTETLCWRPWRAEASLGSVRRRRRQSMRSNGASRSEMRLSKLRILSRRAMFSA